MHLAVKALSEIAEQLKKKDWNFNVDPCTNETSWFLTHLLLSDIMWQSSKLISLEELVFGSLNSKSLEESPTCSCTVGVGFKELLPLLPFARFQIKISRGLYLADLRCLQKVYQDIPI